MTSFPGDNALISIVIPLYNEREILPLLFERLSKTMAGLPYSFEVILIDDGSDDGTAEYCRERVRLDQRIRLLRLSRNFGHQPAISAGIDHARGHAVIVMDGDLQDPPEEIGSLLDKWREGHDVVYAVRQSRTESWPKRAAFWIFYRLFERLSSIPIARDSGDFGLIDRRVADMLRAMPERNRFLRGLRSWVGLSQVGIPVARQPRAGGEAKYSISMLKDLAVDGFVSFSHIPLRLATRIGFIVSAISFAYIVWIVSRRLVTGALIPGWASTIVIVTFLGGIQLITIGIMGEYVGRIYDEVKRRPLYFVAEAVNIEPPVPIHEPGAPSRPPGGGKE